MTLSRILCGISILTIISPVFGQAQDASGDASRGTDTSAENSTAPESKRVSSRLIEEIIVTAQKREENLQDVPISISAFSADTLDARGISDPKDLPLATPGLSVGSQAGYTTTYLRGVGSDAFLLADPSVALYIDGVYFPFAHGQAQNFGSIERVEVLKGPQGTLFGRNAVGGAISVTTKMPSFDEASGSTQISYGRFSDLQTKASINVPLSDSFAFNASALYNNSEPYRRGSTAAGKSLPNEVTKGARLRVRWAPIEQLDVTLSGFRLQQTGTSTMFSTNSEPSPVLGAAIPPQGFNGDVDDSAYFDLDNTVLYGQATWSADWFDAKLIGSDQHVQTSARYDFDGSPLPLVYFEVPDQHANVQTAELQLLSNDTSWGSEHLTWILGYYYYHGTAGLYQANFGVAASLLNGINELLGSFGVRPLLEDDLLVAHGVMQTDSDSIFAQGTYRVTDWLSLTLGGRLQKEARKVISSGGAIGAVGGQEIPYTLYGGERDVTDSFNPKVSLEFRPWDDGLIYTSYQTATKSSTYNVVNFLTFTPTLQPIKKEELAAYEVGLKKTLFGGTTQLTSAAFFYDLKNLQTQFISLRAGGAVTFETAPAAEVKGFDFDIVSQIFPDWVSGLVLTAGGAYVDAKFTDYRNGQGFSGIGGIYTTGNDYTGNRIPRAPKISGTVGLSQTLDVAGGSLEIAADYYYNGGFYYLAQSTPDVKEDAYEIVGARVTYLYEPWRLRTTLFGKNLTDERYNYSRFITDFGSNDAIAPPRSYGVRFNWEF